MKYTNVFVFFNGIIRLLKKILEILKTKDDIILDDTDIDIKFCKCIVYSYVYFDLELNLKKIKFLNLSIETKDVAEQVKSLCRVKSSAIYIAELELLVNH